MHSHTPSHCADAILSLANRSTVVAEVASPLADLVAAWIQTPSDFDELFASAVRSDWARIHRPVVSRSHHRHVLYTGYHATEPNGELVQCHQGCGIENRHYDVHNKFVTITCRGCNSECKVVKTTPSLKTSLSSRSLVRTVFPQPTTRAQWTFKDPKGALSVLKKGPPTILTVVPPTHLAPPPISNRSISLPVEQLPPLPPITPTPPTPVTPAQQALQRPTIALPVRTTAPRMVRSRSAPQDWGTATQGLPGQTPPPQELPKRQTHPEVELSTSSVPKRQWRR